MPRRKIKQERASRLPLVVFLILIVLSFAAIAILNVTNFEDYTIANVLQVSGQTVIIGNNCTAIIQDTSAERAQSIQDGINGIMEQRPNTHDIFAQTLKSFNITLDYVTIDNFVNGTYYSNLFLRSGNKILKLDAKPSDAIALALRTNSTIYINKTLLKEVGTNICQ
jgi:bifunctional DNase/RNase